MKEKLTEVNYSLNSSARTDYSLWRFKLPTGRFVGLLGANKAHSEMFSHDHNLLYRKANWVKGYG